MRKRTAIQLDMPYPAGSTRINLSGTLPGGEIWASGFWLFDTQVGSEDEANTLAEAIANILNASNFGYGAMALYVAGHFNTQSAWTTVTVYHYAAGGTVATYIGRFDLSPATVGNGPRPLPNQCTLVLSLRSGYNGRRNRGRMYLPLTSATLEASGQIDSGTLQQLVPLWAAGFDQIRSQGLGHLSVVSAVGSTDRIITEILMDSRVDIQRRRANSEGVESRVTATLTI